MPRPICVGVFGHVADGTLPPHSSGNRAMLVPSMIDTTSEAGPMKDFNIAPASYERLRRHADHQRRDGADILRDVN